MATKQSSQQTSLSLKRTLAAPRDKVFRAWTRPEELKKWFCRASDESLTSIIEWDLRVGGKYRVEIRSPEGKLYRLAGTYREIKPTERLVYTWKWEEDPEFPETLVTVEFHDRGDSTEVVLTHELFPNEKSREQHQQGWNACIEMLVKSLRRAKA